MYIEDKYKYRIGREGKNLFGLYRGNPIFLEEYDFILGAWVQQDLVGLYDGDITSREIDAITAEEIINGKVEIGYVYRNGVN